MPTPPERPNVLFLFTDDQRFDAGRALGDPAIETPNLDRLASLGTVCPEAYIDGGTSGAICMPSRAMVHTGRGLFEIEGVGQTIPEAHATLGETFREAGYEAFGTGKWHNGTAAYARSFSDGAEIFFGGMDDHWNVPACDFDPTGEYPGRLPTVRDPFRGKERIDRPGDHIRAGYHSTDLFVDATLAFLDRRPRDRPFFAYVSLMAPHDPRVMPERFKNRYDLASIELPANFLPEHPIDTGALDIRDEKLARRPREPEETREHIRDYDAMITHIDAALGRLLDRLEGDGSLDSTLLVFAGDNGLAVGQHGLMGKQNLYDHSVRVPLIFAGPGIPAGGRAEGLCTLSDVFPTLASLCGVSLPGSVTGRDLSGALRDGAPMPREGIYLAYHRSIRGYADRRYKLIEYASGATQLFDRRDDPLEMRNLAEEPAAASQLREMRAKLLQAHRDSGEREHSFGLAFWEARPDLAEADRG